MSLEKLAQIPPVLPVISGHPLDLESAAQDKFELCYRLGPVFDIIRHKDTAMPTTIAIYGDWGTGKTSAMRWLDALIGEWNKSKENTGETKVHTVWFYPWKYHDKEDVWRGLISEVILASINVKGADLPRVEKAAKQFGLFLGRSFLHVLGAVNDKAGSAIQKTIEEFNRVDHPEKAYLNEFESSLKEWTDETLGENDRMVLFIDDLDRCMPEIALQVLEALKLYLNIKKLIFVVGLDKDVIEKLVKDHYEKLSLKDYTKSENYLAKMFQTEVTVGPSESQVTDYLCEQLKQIEYFKEPYLNLVETFLFMTLINKFADRNPREVKRLINSAVMAGAGAEMLKKAGEQKPALSFKQGLQVFFIRKIVENPKTHNMPRLVGSNLGNEFFSKWSEIVRENRGKPPFFPSHIQLSEEYIQKLQQAREDIIFGETLSQMLGAKEKRELFEKPPGVPEPYYELIQNFHFRNLLRLLKDETLGRLMQIEFSSEIAEITQKVEPQPSKKSDEEIIREAIAKELNKTSDELQKEDYSKIESLDLKSRDITDIGLIKILNNLKELKLGMNLITDINPLKGLTNLIILHLFLNQISDLGPLVNLANLVELNLGGNQITDLRPIINLTNLKKLYFWRNKVTDISVLKELTNLTELTLGENNITDINHIKGLKNLTKINLRQNQISDISPIKGLTNLTELALEHNQIRNINPLEDLTNLTELHLGENQIRDISPLKGLTELTKLGLEVNQINDIIVLKELTKLENLDIRVCPKITDEQVAELQKALPKLRIVR